MRAFRFISFCEYLCACARGRLPSVLVSKHVAFYMHRLEGKFQFNKDLRK